MLLAHVRIGYPIKFSFQNDFFIIFVKFLWQKLFKFQYFPHSWLKIFQNSFIKSYKH
jgi:hypothetical protein